MGLWRRRLALVVAGAAMVVGWPDGVRAGGRWPARPVAAPLDPLTAADRLLVLAPHEDDEVLGAGGLLQQAVAAHAAVRVVYLTYGDHNELAFLLYRKRPWLTPAFHTQMGEVRRREAIAATAHLGLAQDQLVFLGYPDGGLLEIWTRHWGAAPPWRSHATRASRVPYPDAVAYDRPHKGDAIVEDLARQLVAFRPTRILVTQPMDGHPDHRACYLFLQAALLLVEDRLPPPRVWTYPIHLATWPHPYGFRPEAWLPIPQPLASDAWRLVMLTPAQVTRKYEAIRLNTSQMAGAWYWLAAFARRNELFLEAPTLALSPEAWSPTERALARPESAAYKAGGLAEDHVSGVAYRGSPEGLEIGVALRRPMAPELGVSVYTFGYRRDRPFADMPKLHITWDLGLLRVDDQGVRLHQPAVRVNAAPNQILVMVPWEALGTPEVVFAQGQGLVGGTPVTQSGWRVLRRAPASLAS